jgi:hypothetical protein
MARMSPNHNRGTWTRLVPWKGGFAPVTAAFLSATLLIAGPFLCSGGQAPTNGSASTSLPAVQAVVSNDAPASGKLALPRVNREFKQNSGSCVLASYAIVASYFTGQQVTRYFEGYCEHFQVTYTNAADAEEKYAEHFDAEWRKRNCRGYEVILDLHRNSKVGCFAEARRFFEGRFFLDSSKHLHELEELLSTKEAFLNITYEPGIDYHSITVMFDGKGLLARDTNKKGLFPIPGWQKSGNCGTAYSTWERAPGDINGQEPPGRKAAICPSTCQPPPRALTS